MSHVTSPTSDTEILSVVIAPDEPDIDVDAARWIMTLKFSAEQNARMLELADKNNEGTISGTEHAELDSYLRVGNLLNFLKAKARSSLGSMEH